MLFACCAAARKTTLCLWASQAPGKQPLPKVWHRCLYAARQGTVKQRVPEHLRNAEILALDVPGMLAGARFRGDFEQRIKAVIKEALQRENVILFIDEIHTIVGAGAQPRIRAWMLPLF